MKASGFAFWGCERIAATPSMPSCPAEWRYACSHSLDGIEPRRRHARQQSGPSDGLQCVARTMSTPHKPTWITALPAARLREIEVCSFMPAKRLAQMADAVDVVRHAG
jgi:hypothetical protein